MKLFSMDQKKQFSDGVYGAYVLLPASQYFVFKIGNINYFDVTNKQEKSFLPCHV